MIDYQATFTLDQYGCWQEMQPLVCIEPTTPVVPDQQKFRHQVMVVQEELAKLPQLDCPLNHHFAPGAYAREILLPAGSLVIGKIHKHSHINVISKGRVSVMTEHGRVDMQAPHTFVSQVGTKRVVYAHEDTVWTTVHVTEETELEKLEDEIIAKTYDELEMLEYSKKLLSEVNS
jgi:hypothetical protein